MFDRLIHPPMTPEQFQEPRWARFLFAGTTAAWLWLVVRLYMAYVYLPAGWGKITSGKWLFGDGSPIQGLVGGAISSEDTPA
jgi:thiosulfate dehydrogenase (quinone) large subunit